MSRNAHSNENDRVYETKEFFFVEPSEYSWIWRFGEFSSNLWQRNKLGGIDDFDDFDKF